MRRLVVALAACAVAAPGHAATAPAPATVNAMKDIYAAGFRDCSGAMEKVVKFVHDDDEAYSYLGLWAEQDPNKQMATTITSQEFADGHGIASISAVKTAAGTCDIVLTQTLTTPDQTCDQLRKTVFKDWKDYADFNKTKMYQDPTTPNAKVVLVPIAQTGCVMVKTLVGFGL